MTVTQSTKPFSNNITVTLKRLVSLLEEDEVDEYGILQPSQYAFKLAMRLVIDAYEIMGDRFPPSSVSTDDQGNIRLTWNNQLTQREVRLVCPVNTNQQAYLYHEARDIYAVEQNVIVGVLVQWLEWLI